MTCYMFCLREPTTENHDPKIFEEYPSLYSLLSFLFLLHPTTKHNNSLNCWDKKKTFSFFNHHLEITKFHKMRQLFLLVRPVQHRITLPKPLNCCPSGCYYMATLPRHAPSTWRESMAITAHTVRYICREIFGKWSVWGIAFGIKYHMKLQVYLITFC